MLLSGCRMRRSGEWWEGEGMERLCGGGAAAWST